MAAGAKGVWRRERVGRRRHDGLGQSSLLDMEVSTGLIYQSPGSVNGQVTTSKVLLDMSSFSVLEHEQHEC